MKNLQYEELKEIRRGFGILFVLVLTYLGDLLKGYVKNPNPLEKETLLLISVTGVLFIAFIGIVLITGVIWKLSKGDKNG